MKEANETKDLKIGDKIILGNVEWVCVDIRDGEAIYRTTNIYEYPKSNENPTNNCRTSPWRKYGDFQD